MRIAIFGSGYTGLACTWYSLQKFPQAEVTLISPKLFGGASRIAAGLLHPYAGQHANLNPRGHEGLKATEELLEIAGEELGRKVAEQQGLIRIAISEKQQYSFRRCADLHADVEWMQPTDIQKFTNQPLTSPGILIKSARTVYSSLYLEGLWKACERRGAQFNTGHYDQEISKNYDLVIAALGAGFLNYPEFKHLTLNPVKGQLMQLSWPEGTPPLTYPMNSQAYIVMTPDNKSCIVGATYERGHIDDKAVSNNATDELLQKAIEICPHLARSEIQLIEAGIRISTPNRLPLIQQTSDNTWVIGGMGSKGLLYHSLYARQLLESVVCSV